MKWDLRVPLLLVPPVMWGLFQPSPVQRDRRGWLVVLALLQRFLVLPVLLGVSVRLQRFLVLRVLLGVSVLLQPCLDRRA